MEPLVNHLHRQLAALEQEYSLTLDGKLWVGATLVWAQFTLAPDSAKPMNAVPLYTATPSAIAPRLQYQLRSGEFEWEANLSIAKSLIVGKEESLINAPGVAGYSYGHQGMFPGGTVSDFEVYLDRLYETPVDAMTALRDWLATLCVQET